MKRFLYRGHLSQHEICQRCVRRYVECKVMDLGLFRIVCPGAECQVELLHDEVREVASQNAFTRYH